MKTTNKIASFFKAAYFDFIGGYWFLPTVMCISAIVIFGFSLSFDLTSQSKEILESSGLKFLRITPSGSRAFLTSVSGSLITVLGVVFSITMLLVSHVSGQFTPRVLSNFMENKTIQFTLGLFTSTFLFNILVLISIRTKNGDDGYTFTPQFSVLTSFFLVLCCIFSLIHFFNHVPQSIRLCNILDLIGSNLLRSLKIESNELGELKENSRMTDPISTTLYKNEKVICSVRSGHLVQVKKESLRSLAEEYDLYVKLEFYLGDYIHNSNKLLTIYKRSTDLIPIENFDELSKKLRDCFRIKNERTSRSDTLFNLDQLIEILAKSLSPGINDPHSAFEALDWIFDSFYLSINLKIDPETIEVNKSNQPQLSYFNLSSTKILRYTLLKIYSYVSVDFNANVYLSLKISNLIKSDISMNDRRFLSFINDKLKVALTENESLIVINKSEDSFAETLFKSHIEN